MRKAQFFAALCQQAEQARNRMVADGWSYSQADSMVSRARSWLMRGHHHTETENSARCGAVVYRVAMWLLAGISYPEQTWGK